MQGSCYSQSIGFVEIHNDGWFMVRATLVYSLSGQDLVRETGEFPYGRKKCKNFSFFHALFQIL